MSRTELARALQVLGIAESPALPDVYPATEADAMGLPPFGRAVALLANAIASTGWYARRHDPDTGLWQRIDDQPTILTDPNPLSTPWHYRWAVTEDGILYGNHFALPGDIDWRTGRPGWVVPIPADQVWILTDQSRPGWFAWVIGGTEIDADALVHIPFGNRSGEVLGRGVLDQYGDWLGGVVAAESYSRDTFAAGALPPAVITTNQTPTQPQADELKAKWRTIVTAREPVIFPNGTELKPVIGNAQQAQLVEARTWNAQMVANAVGVPGWKLGLDGPTMTYQNIETADIDFTRDGVDRWANPIAAVIGKWLLPAGWDVAFDYTARQRADAQATATVLTTYKNAGVLTTDEVRAALNRPPLPEPVPATGVGTVEGDAAAGAPTDAAAPAAPTPAPVAAASIPTSGGDEA